MVKTKDFYGKDIPDVIEQACKAFAVPQDALAIEVLETGSTGIFGLCKKKAHIRVQRKEELGLEEEPAARQKRTRSRGKKDKKHVPAEPQTEQDALATSTNEPAPGSEPFIAAINDGQDENAKLDEDTSGSDHLPDELEDEGASGPAPSEEELAAIRETTHQLLSLMRMPSEVEVTFAQNSIHCDIKGGHEETLLAFDGRVLDSMQYLLRKMLVQQLPERVVLVLNAGNFRERRLEDLKTRALEFAALVRQDGKTRAMAALNPSERRFVHLALQEDKEIRSRSVGDGLFKKVLIYKPGSGAKGQKRRPSSRKRQGGGQSGRSSED